MSKREDKFDAISLIAEFMSKTHFQVSFRSLPDDLQKVVKSGISVLSERDFNRLYKEAMEYFYG